MSCPKIVRKWKSLRRLALKLWFTKIYSIVSIGFLGCSNGQAVAAGFEGGSLVSMACAYYRTSTTVGKETACLWPPYFLSITKPDPGAPDPSWSV